jgi:ZIP family zinc transporter
LHSEADLIEAAFWGALGASALLIGAVIAFVFDVPKRTQGLILAFGAGTLFGAVAYELFEEAVGISVGGLDVAIGFGLGATVFYLGSLAIDRMSPAGPDGMPSKRDPRTGGLALVLGAVLDGIPESIVLGLSLLSGEGIGVAVLAAVFISNLPEGLSASEDLSAGGTSRRKILGLWGIVVLASAVASAIGYGVLGQMGPRVVVLLDSFAAGAILAMLAESMIPEAYEEGGRAVGLATTFGFAIAAALSFQT